MKDLVHQALACDFKGYLTRGKFEKMLKEKFGDGIIREITANQLLGYLGDTVTHTTATYYKETVTGKKIVALWAHGDGRIFNQFHFPHLPKYLTMFL